MAARRCSSSPRPSIQIQVGWLGSSSKHPLVLITWQIVYGSTYSWYFFLHKIRFYMKRTTTMLITGWKRTVKILSVNCSVPYPDPPDPRVFWPPGSGSTSQRYGSGSGSGSGSFYHHAKIIRKILNPTMWLFLTFYLRKIMLMYLQKIKAEKIVLKNSFFAGISKVNDENSRIRVH